MRTRTKLKAALITTLLLGAVVAGGFALKTHLSDSAGAVHAAPVAAPPPMPVKVTSVQTEPVRLWTEYSGRLAAVDSVEIRPQVSGTITEIRFQDGQSVKKGDILVVIDPRPYAAAVAEAKGELSAARHRVVLAKKQRDRAERLVKNGHVSKSVLDERINDHTVAVSQVETAKAKLERAEIDLDYAHIKAPISGRLSRAEITLGNLVEAGPEAPVLTSIVSMDSVYADFEVDERTYLRYMHSGATVGDDASVIPVDLIIDAGKLHTYHGYIQSFDNRIDPATGTIRARAIFTNKDGRLLPGTFASVRLGSPDMRDVVLIDAGAVGTDQDRKFVYVLDDANKVTYREVALGA
ncbi:MAG: efflux RND transporter periplasmic adaptor subunit, partial [Alphaproteobacteria bacterium]|nr:efflux RND transporter periplasmic adaptor subunit [Alphaproteobacteria bacterium]